MHKENAFTLIEVIIVITVMAIIAAAIALSFLSIEPGKLDGVANRLMFDLRYAQQLAISRHVSCGILFNPDGNNYYVYVGSTSTKAIDPYTKRDHLIDYDTDTGYKGVDLVSTAFGNGDQIYFNWTGTPYKSNDVALSTDGIITLQCGLDTRTVTIEPNTGMVKTP